MFDTHVYVSELLHTLHYIPDSNFDMLSENIPPSTIFPAYKICSLKAGPKAFLRMLPREIVRRCLFNKLSVEYFLLPILQRANTNRLAALFGNNITYRGTIYYHVRKALRDVKKRKVKGPNQARATIIS